MQDSSPVTASPDGTVIGHGRNKQLGLIAIIISATGMGLVGTLSRLATPLDPASGQRYVIGDFLAFGRMGVGALGLILILVLVKKIPKLRTTRLSASVVAGGLCIGASLAFYVSSTLMTTIANAVFLIYTGPLFSAILAWVFLKERIDLKRGLFLGLVFVGMLMTIGIINYAPEAGFTFGLDLGADPELPQKTTGDVFGLVSGLFYGLALFFYRHRPDIDSEVRSFWNFVFGMVGALIVMVFRIAVIDPTNPLEVMHGTYWLWAIVLFVVCGLVAIGFLVVAGKHLLAVELSTLAYWECVVALILGLFLWDEPITVLGAIGGLLIIIGGLGPALIFRTSPHRLGTPKGERPGGSSVAAEHGTALHDAVDTGDTASPAASSRGGDARR